MSSEKYIGLDVPQSSPRPRKRQRLPPNPPIANAPARHTCELTRLHGAGAFAIGH